MNIPEIENHLKAVQEYVLQILPDESEKIRDIIFSKTIIAGGAIASLMLDEPVNDYDVFFLTKEGRDSFFEAIDRKAIRLFNEGNKKILKGIPVFGTQNAVTLNGVVKIQFIKSTEYFNKNEERQPVDVTNEFDFVHCKGIYRRGKLYVYDEIEKAIMHKRLVLNKKINTNFLSETKRLLKFIGRGWQIDHYELSKFMKCINNQDLIESDDNY